MDRADVIAKAQTISKWTTEAQHKLLWDLGELVRDVPGQFCELGVGKGATAVVLAHMALDPVRYTMLFDTFRGNPEPELEDLQLSSARGVTELGGKCACSLQEVATTLAELGVRDRCLLVPGDIAETTVGIDTELALVHLDCDLYRSAMAAMEFVARNLQPGGIVVVNTFWGAVGTVAAQRAAVEGWTVHKRGDIGRLWLRRPYTTTVGSEGAL